MKTKLICFLLALGLVFSVTTSSAQEWSKEQKEVWGQVEEFTDAWAKRDLAGYIGHLDEHYTGWYHNEPLPVTRESLKKWETYNLKSQKIQVYELNPVAIKLHGDTAIVQYYFKTRREDPKGDSKMQFSKWTEILQKKDGKWLFIATHGSRVFSE